MKNLKFLFNDATFKNFYGFASVKNEKFEKFVKTYWRMYNEMPGNIGGYGRPELISYHNPHVSQPGTLGAENNFVLRNGDSSIFSSNNNDNYISIGFDTEFTNDNYLNLPNTQANGQAGNDVIYGNKSENTLFGGTQNHQITGGYQNLPDNDLIMALAGDDFVYGGGGNDFLMGNEGEDFVFGGEGNDIVEGNQGNDNLSGDDGDDVIIGGIGSDYMTGGKGHDVFVLGGNFLDHFGRDEIADFGAHGTHDFIWFQDTMENLKIDVRVNNQALEIVSQLTNEVIVDVTVHGQYVLVSDNSIHLGSAGRAPQQQLVLSDMRDGRAENFDDATYYNPVESFMG